MKRFKQYLTESSNSIVVLDVDDTIIHSAAKIRVKEHDVWKTLSTDQFAKQRGSISKDAKYDFSDFRDFQKIYDTITHGKIIKNILKIIDDAVNNNVKIGILTARAKPYAILVALKTILRYRDSKTNELKPIPRDLFRKKFVFAVGEPSTRKLVGRTMDGSENPEDVKALVLQKVFGDKYGFGDIKFYDDDKSNISAVNKLDDKRIKAILVSSDI